MSKYYDPRAGHTYYLDDEQWTELCNKIGENPEACESIVFGLQGGQSYTVEPLRLQIRKGGYNEKT